MLRSAFLKRMALVAAACAFIDVPAPRDQAVRKSYHFHAYVMPVAKARKRTTA